MDVFTGILRKQDNLLTDFDEKLWYSLVEYVTIYNNMMYGHLLKIAQKIQA